MPEKTEIEVTERSRLRIYTPDEFMAEGMLLTTNIVVPPGCRIILVHDES